MTSQPESAPLCRSCDNTLTYSIADLGSMPLANSYLLLAQRTQEKSYPLHAYVCERCWLVQVPPMATPDDIFSEYAYFSSFSDTWRTHCAEYAKKMTSRLTLDNHSQVIEIASNDGILLQQFQLAGIKVMGIEPAQNIAAYANERNIPTRALFFGAKTAQKLVDEGVQADLLIANNVLAHVPNIHDFIAGFVLLLKPQGTITFEFPHLLEMLRHTQFDTIYHEHFSYLSLTALAPLFQQHGLVMVDVEQLTTHGGSLRVFVQHQGAAMLPTVGAILNAEETFGLTSLKTYQTFDTQIKKLRTDLLVLLNKLRSEGKRIAAYGAPAKGNTLLNYCGIGTELVDYTVDRNPEKQTRLLPGSHLPIHAPDYLLQDKPDIVFILPWNIAEEVMQQLSEIREWGGQFLIAVPEPKLL